MKGPDRYLKARSGRFYYCRRVPTRFAHLDTRGVIEETLGTDSLENARRIRDALAEADEAHWRTLVIDGGGDPVQARYDAAKARAKALGVSYRSLPELIKDAPVGDLVARMKPLHGKTGADLKRTADAVLGGAPEPVLTVTKALDEFLAKIAPGELAGKSPKQIEDYKKVKHRAVNNFVARHGNKPFWSISRDDALVFYDWWQARVDDGMSGNSGNRDVGNMRRLWRDLAKRSGRRDLHNPFDGLSFKDPKRLRNTPPPFPTAWICDKLLRVEAYGSIPGHPRAFLRDAAAIFLTVIETGCRPSEICNLTPERIMLDADVPHLVIGFDAHRQIKTESSARVVPLVGIALEAMKRNPKGFARYRDRETTFSNTMMKHLRARGLLPSDKHVVYSARHAFEDRMKEAGVDVEMRKLLMGHSIDRPEYGIGGSLDLRLTLLERIVLPFDPALLDYLNGPA